MLRMRDAGPDAQSAENQILFPRRIFVTRLKSAFRGNSHQGKFSLQLRRDDNPQERHFLFRTGQRSVYLSDGATAHTLLFLLTCNSNPLCRSVG